MEESRSEGEEGGRGGKGKNHDTIYLFRLVSYLLKLTSEMMRRCARPLHVAVRDRPPVPRHLLWRLPLWNWPL